MQAWASLACSCDAGPGMLSLAVLSSPLPPSPRMEEGAMRSPGRTHMPMASRQAPGPRWAEQERGGQERRRGPAARPPPAGLGCFQEDKWVTPP